MSVGSVALRAYGRAACLAHTHLGGSGGMPPPDKNLSAPLNESLGVCTYWLNYCYLQVQNVKGGIAYELHS